MARPESQLYYFDNNPDNHFTKRVLSSTKYVKDPNDALQGMGSFISQESFTADMERGVDEFLDVEWKDKDKRLEYKENISKGAMKFAKPDSYLNSSLINEDGFSLDDYPNSNK